MPNIAHYSHDNHETEKLYSTTETPYNVKEKHRKEKRTPKQKVSLRAIPIPIITQLRQYQWSLIDKPQHHLRGKDVRKYCNIKEDITEIKFELALEVLNRRSMRPVRKPLEYTDEISEYFFESIGRVRTSMKMCVRCRDRKKDAKTKDLYFMDLVEVTSYRTIFCKECMMIWVKCHVLGTAEEIKEELKSLRERQPKGVYVDPFLITCGY